MKHFFVTSNFCIFVRGADGNGIHEEFQSHLVSLVRIIDVVTMIMLPHWHELWKQEKCSSLVPPRGIFITPNELKRVPN